VPVPPGEVTLRQVWEGIIATEAEVIIALPEPGLFETPTALRADHPPQVPLDVALDAIAEPLDLVWYGLPSGLLVAHERVQRPAGTLPAAFSREALALWCALSDLSVALPTDEDRARFLSGEWVQPLSWDCPFGRAVARVVRRLDEPAREGVNGDPPPAVLLTGRATCSWRPAGGGRGTVFGGLIGREHGIPPKTGLLVSLSPDPGGPRSLATAKWRERVARPATPPSAPPEPWRLADLIPPLVDLCAVLGGARVAYVSPAPVGPQEPLRACSAEGIAVTPSAAFETTEMLVAIRNRPVREGLDALCMSLGSEAKPVGGGVFVGPGGQSRPDWAVGSIGELLDRIVRPSFRAALAGTGADPEWADEAWRCVAWRPDTALSEAQRNMFAGAPGLLGLFGPESPPPAGSERAVRIGFDLRLGRPVEEWTLTGPAGTYAVLGHENLSAPGVGLFEPRGDAATPRDSVADTREEGAR